MCDRVAEKLFLNSSVGFGLFVIGENGGNVDPHVTRWSDGFPWILEEKPLRPTEKPAAILESVGDQSIKFAFLDNKGQVLDFQDKVRRDSVQLAIEL